MARKQNSWLVHVKKTLRENRDKSFKQVLKLAKKTYKRSAFAASESKGVRKSRRHHKTRRGGSSGSSSGEQKMQENQQQGGNKNDQQGELPGVGKQQGGSSGNPLADLMKGDGAQKGGSGTGGGGSKAEFGANAGSV
jgi:hypothetical protein